MQDGNFGGGVFAGVGGQQHLHLGGRPWVAMFNQPVDWGAALGLGFDPAGMGAPAGHDSAVADSTEQAESSTAGQQGSTDRQQVCVSTWNFCSLLYLLWTVLHHKVRLRFKVCPKDRLLCGR